MIKRKLTLKKKRETEVSVIKNIYSLEELKSMTLEDIDKIKAFTGQENLTSDELNILMDHEDEFSRKGNFSRVFPLAANVDYYERFFEIKRYMN